MTARHTIIATIFLVLITGAAQAACASAPAGYKGVGKESFPVGEGRSVSAGGLELQARKGDFATWISDARMIDSWACVSFWFPETKDDSIAAGVVFWMKDPRNFYIAAARRNGSFGIWQHTAKGWETINSGGLFWFYVNSPQGPIVRTGPDSHAPGHANQIEVITLGDNARVFINGRMVMNIGRQPPGAASSIGIYAEADADQDNLWQIESVSIINLCHADSSGYCY